MFMVPRGEFAPPLGRPVRYPLGILGIWESMFIPGATTRHIRSVARIHQGKFFRLRATVENGVAGVHVTRTNGPEGPRRSGRLPKYPLRMMQVGDSMFIPGETPRSMQARWKWMKPKRFKSRTVVKSGVAGVRVWRIA